MLSIRQVIQEKHLSRLPNMAWDPALSDHSLFDPQGASENTVPPVRKGWEVSSDCGKLISFSQTSVVDPCMRRWEYIIPTLFTRAIASVSSSNQVFLFDIVVILWAESAFVFSWSTFSILFLELVISCFVSTAFVWFPIHVTFWSSTVVSRCPVFASLILLLHQMKILRKEAKKENVCKPTIELKSKNCWYQPMVALWTVHLNLSLLQ